MKKLVVLLVGMGLANVASAMSTSYMPENRDHERCRMDGKAVCVMAPCDLDRCRTLPDSVPRPCGVVGPCDHVIFTEPSCLGCDHHDDRGYHTGFEPLRGGRFAD